jgi:hypothetical protein
MNRLIRTELLKLRTMRATYGLALLVVAHTALFAALEATRAGRKVAPISTAQGLATVSTATGVTMILAAVLGVLLSSGEYRHTSASLTYLATPRRSRVLAAKATAAAVAGLVYGILAGLVATGTALVFIAAHHDHVTLGTRAFRRPESEHHAAIAFASETALGRASAMATRGWRGLRPGAAMRPIGFRAAAAVARVDTTHR